MTKAAVSSKKKINQIPQIFPLWILQYDSDQPGVAEERAHV